jgi:hypothetical protein
MRDRIIGALDSGCRRGEMLKIQNKHVDWRQQDAVGTLPIVSRPST